MLRARGMAMDGQTATVNRRVMGSPANIPQGSQVEILEVKKQRPTRKRDKFGNVETTKHDDRVRVRYEGHDYWVYGGDLE
jgi:hypothetical protein